MAATLRIRKIPQRMVYGILAAIVIAFLHISVFAISLSEYRASVQMARNGVKGLIDDAKTRTKSGERDTVFENRLIEDVRGNVPASQKIEWKGSSAETGNQWIHEKLDSFQAEKDSVKRLAILNEADERLAAILIKIDELEKPPVSGRTKDEDKKKLEEILGREEYKVPESKDESVFARWWREFTEWLESIFPKPKNLDVPNSGSGSLSFILQIIVYALVIGAIGFLIYKFVPGLFERYSGRVKTKKKDRVILGEHIAADESAESLFGEAERLAREGNLRGAIRKGYIALLCELSDRKIVGLAQHKTNRDYLRDVRSREELYHNMNGMTSSFERHWYGFQTAEERDWDEFRQSFRRATETAVS